MEPMEQAQNIFFESLECFRAGAHGLAEKKLREALALVPLTRGAERAAIFANLAGVLIAQERIDDAREFCEEAIREGSADEVVWLNLGICQLARHAHEHALRSIDRALAINPGYPEALLNRSNVLQDLGRIDEALTSLDRAIAIAPDYVDAHYNRSNLLLQNLGDVAGALAGYDKVLALAPDFSMAHSNRGAALERLGRYQEALVAYDHAVLRDPGLAQAHNNRGMVLQVLERFDDALASFDRAIAVRPDYAEAYSNRGNLFKDMNRFDSAIASFDRALDLAPDFAAVHWNKALAHLTCGDFENGWREYEWRWKDAGIQAHHGVAGSLWLGDFDIAGRTILLHDEQGLGDTIHFCRYVEKVAALGARVILKVQPALVQTLTGLAGAAEIVTDLAEEFDCHCPLMSLPLAFHTQLPTIPHNVPYLRARPEKSGKWQQTLRGLDGYKVGVVWSGSIRTDRWQVTRGVDNQRADVSYLSNENRRSLPLVELATLFDIGVNFIVLQKELRESDRMLLARFPQVYNYSGALDDFSDTAALIENLDLVIAVDTSVAHLAGALGKPVWIMLSAAAEWRWLLDRNDSPWYPTARLFRQPTLGDWKGVVRALGSALKGAGQTGVPPATDISGAGYH